MQINSLNITFQNLIVEQENLQKKQDNLNKKQFEIRDLENKIERLNIYINQKKYHYKSIMMKNALFVIPA